MLKILRRFDKLNPALRLALVTAVSLVLAWIVLLGFSGSPSKSASAGMLIFQVLFGVVATVWLSFFIAIAWHEAGHIAFGKVVGFKFRAVEVFGLGLRATSAGLKPFRATSRFSGGFARMDTNGQERIVSRFSTFIWGGPVASLILLGFSYWLWVTSQPPAKPSVEAVFMNVLAFTFLLTNAWMCISCLVPTIIQGAPTDMLLLIRLWTNAHPERSIALLRIGEQISRGERARDWDPHSLSLGAELHDGSVDELSLRYLRYYHLADSDDLESAGKGLDRGAQVAETLGQSTGFIGNVVAWERVFDMAWHRKEPELARGLMPEKGKVNDFSEEAMERSFAAIALAEGKFEDAQEHIEAARTSDTTMCKRLGLVASTDGLWIDQLEAALEAARHPTQP